MNCPYCDETIHPQAKFCAKCGLPLREDTTVHGVSASDDAGPSKWVIGALLGGIAIIGLLIFGLGSQRPQETQQVRQPAPRIGMPSPGMGTGVAGTTPTQPAFSGAQAARPTFQAPRADANTTSQTRYASAPPPPRIPMAYPTPEPMAPPVPLLMMTTGDAPKPPRVTIDRGTTPVIPSLPDSVAMAAIPQMPDTLEPTVEEGEQVNPNPRLYVWDPVHERWARRQDVPRRPATRTRRTGRSASTYDPNRYLSTQPAREQ